MTSQKEFLGRLVKALDDSNIAYMLSGSIGSSLHGRPRATNDADIVIDPTQQQLTGFLDSLGPDYYVSRPTALDALKNRTMFNVIGIASGWKADIIIVKDRAYSREEFDRRKTATVMGMNLCVVSPEDCILRVRKGITSAKRIFCRFVDYGHITFSGLKSYSTIPNGRQYCTG